MIFVFLLIIKNEHYQNSKVLCLNDKKISNAILFLNTIYNFSYLHKTHRNQGKIQF